MKKFFTAAAVAGLLVGLTACGDPAPAPADTDRAAFEQAVREAAREAIKEAKNEDG